MKGWIDRVFTQGFAFSLKNMYDNGVFKVSVSERRPQMQHQPTSHITVSEILQVVGKSYCV